MRLRVRPIQRDYLGRTDSYAPKISGDFHAICFQDPKYTGLP
jgi:hypothetical protein